MMEQDMQEILFTPEALAQRVKELADQINRDYAGKSPMVVGTLRAGRSAWRRRSAACPRTTPSGYW